MSKESKELLDWQSSLQNECLMTDARCLSLLFSLSLENVFLPVLFFRFICWILDTFNHDFVSKVSEIVITYLELKYLPKFYLKSKEMCVMYTCFTFRFERTSLHWLLNQLVAQIDRNCMENKVHFLLLDN